MIFFFLKGHGNRVAARGDIAKGEPSLGRGVVACHRLSTGHAAKFDARAGHALSGSIAQDAGP